MEVVLKLGMELCLISEATNVVYAMVYAVVLEP